MTSVAAGRTHRRRRHTFGHRAWLWPLLLIPIVMWGAYKVGTPWPESAPLNASWENYGEPWDVHQIQTLLQGRGHELNLREIKFVRPEDTDTLDAPSSPIVEADVEFDGRGAHLLVYADAASKQRDWRDSTEQPHGLGLREAWVFDFGNVVVLESAWGRAGLGEALQDAAR